MNKNALLLDKTPYDTGAANLAETSINKTTTSFDSNITDTTTIFNKDLSNSIDQLTTTISSLPEPINGLTTEQIIIALSVPLIGALSAYLFNRFHWLTIEKKNKISQVCSTLDLLIKELEEVSVEYWMQGYKKINRDKINASEISIKSKNLLISKYITTVNTLYLKAPKTELNEFSSKIFDLTTGDEFESTSRTPSKLTATRIAMKCSGIRATISTLNF